MESRTTIATLFKCVAAKIALQRREQMTIAQRRITLIIFIVLGP